MLFPVVALLFGVTVAQRPSDVTICDYYAQQRYGSSDEGAQFQLIQGIVSYAFGGSMGLTNLSADITGILHPGVFEDIPVDLQPWFNGSKQSTNLNNQPIGINWLDSGGMDPLYAYLSGQTANVTFEATSNEYRLFAHFFVSFSRLFGCSNPPKPPPSNGPPLNLAYVHKFMSLKHEHLGYFINQLTGSAVHFGFAQTDADSINTRLNSLYNVRCAPAITLNSKQGPQLLSLCQDQSCPLAVPNADCASYVNLTADGAVAGASSSSGSASATLAPTSISSTSITPASTSPATATTSPAETSPAAAAAAPALSTGGIAGVAVGGAAVLLGFIVAMVFLLRRRRQQPISLQGPGSQWGGSTVVSGNEPKPALTPGGWEYPSPHSGPTSPYFNQQHASFQSGSYMSEGTAGYPAAEVDAVGTHRVASPPVELHAGERGWNAR